MAMPRPTVAQLAYGSCTVVLSTLAMLLLSGASSGAGVAVVAVAALAVGLLVAMTVPLARPQHRPRPVPVRTAAGHTARPAPVRATVGAPAREPVRQRAASWPPAASTGAVHHGLGRLVVQPLLVRPVEVAPATGDHGPHAGTAEGERQPQHGRAHQRGLRRGRRPVV